jgi:hypothetical protein
MDPADSSVIDLLQGVVDSASAVVGESPVHREEPVVRSPEAGRLPVTLAGMGEGERIRRGGTEAVPHRVGGMGPWQWRLRSKGCAGQQRDAAWARLEALAGESHEAQARIAALIAELRGAEGIDTKLEAEMEMWRAKDAEYRRFRGQCHWLGVLLSGR